MKPTISLYHPTGAVFALLQAVLFAAALIILGSAIGWPGILREPASVVLPRIEANRLAMLLGYSAYLLSSLTLIPVALALSDRLKAAGATSYAANTLAFLGAAGGILKILGIVRWLSVMPLLSAHYVATDSPALRQIIEFNYLTINGYAGAVGELLGVQLVTGIWMAGVSVLLIRHVHAWWSGGLGLVAGLGFVLTAGRVIEPALAAVQSVAVPLGLIWLVALAVVMLRGKA